jgi:hypothetical protein
MRRKTWRVRWEGIGPACDVVAMRDRLLPCILQVDTRKGEGMRVMYSCFSRVASNGIRSTIAMMKLKVQQQLEGSTAGVRDSEISPLSTWEESSPVDWRIQSKESASTPHHHLYSNHVHVAGTGNDQTIAAAGERVSRMPPHLHITRQTATAAVSGWCNCWFVYPRYIQQDNRRLTPPKKACNPPVPPPHRVSLNTKSLRPPQPLRLCLPRMPLTSSARP